MQCAIGTEEMTLARFMAYEIAAGDSATEAVARAWFASHTEALRCAADLDGYITPEPCHDWNAAWQQSEWKASVIGKKLWLTPPWDHTPAPDGRIRLAMHPGTLFGNGDHPTTQLCLEALQRHVTDQATVADIGCGSGLLSQAALLLGARHAIGCDLDWQAVRQVSGIAFQGSVDSLMHRSIDILIANIQVGVLATLLPEIRRSLKPDGVAILSGILNEQIGMLPVTPTRIEHNAGWACLEVCASGLR